MRAYPRNSPHASARLVALTLIADGHLGSRELAALERAGAHEQLGLGPADLHEVLRHLAEDLVATAGWSGTAELDPAMVGALLSEVDDPGLQQTVAELALAAAQADGHLASGEQALLASARLRWGVDCTDRAANDDHLAWGGREQT
ncbi:TerB family tellurite resistance protein [Ramlibacter tataouinensis]|uniref:TerB family tellurite resistance protein n=1 Tax=Ramlibacter tataouinensis TaxID=94132 RepID=UPI0022F39447|nr:TerB family tellurite resistance protein [Ramlibacter tataouinensis]WBY00318.1 TerB family tellurite resistance protein [Ramlibacter tataouinensis]